MYDLRILDMYNIKEINTILNRNNVVMVALQYDKIESTWNLSVCRKILSTTIQIFFPKSTFLNFKYLRWKKIINLIKFN